MAGSSSQIGTGAPPLEAVTQHFVDSLAGAPPIHTLSPDAAREALVRVQSGTVGRPATRVVDTSFPVGPSGAVRVRILRPEIGDEVLLPALLYLHGGGWMLGDASTHDRLLRELANGARGAVVFVDYARAPESRFPSLVEEAYAAACYVAERGDGLGLDGSRLAVAGDGSGGNLAAVVCHMARERRGPRIACQVLFYPVTDSGLDTGSYAQFADGSWLTRAAMERFWDAYLPDPAARKHPAASPLQASHDELRGLPDALVITAESDVLRDEGEAYARKLAEAGVRVTSTRYNGTIHGFVTLNALADTPAARGAIAQAVAALRGALE